MSASIANHNEKKSSLSSAFIKQFGKYLKEGSKTYIQKAAPETMNNIDQAKSSISEVRTKLKSTTADINRTVRSINIQTGMRNIYSWFMNESKDLDEDSGTEEHQEYDDGTESNSASSIADTQISEDKKNANKIAKTYIDATKKQIEASVNLTSNITDKIEKQTATISSGFNSVEKKLDELIKVVSENTGTIINIQQAVALGEEEGEGQEEEYEGGFSLNKYKKTIESNFMSTTTGLLVESVKNFFGDFKPDAIVASSIEKLIDKAAPNFTQNVQEIDQAVGNMILGSLSRLGDKQGKNWFTSELRNIFGIKEERDNTYTGRSTLELKAVPFDSVSKEAITSAIPGYLRKILAGITGEDIIYDYRSKSFKTKGKIKNDFREQANNSYNLSNASESIKRAFSGNNSSKMVFELMMNNLTDKSGSGLSEVIDGFKDLRKTQNYILDELYNGQAKKSDLDDIKQLAENINKLVRTAGGGKELQGFVTRTAANRNRMMDKYMQQADLMGMDLSFIDDSAASDAKYIKKKYGRKDLASDSSIKKGDASGTKGLDGLNYTNRALFEIYRRLDEGINVFQVGHGNRKKPYSKLDLLKEPYQYKPKMIKKGDDKETFSSSNNPLDAHEKESIYKDVDYGDSEGVGKAGKYVKHRGGDLLKALTKGTSADVRDAFGAIIGDVKNFGTKKAKGKLSEVNDKYGNVKGYINHELFGLEYEYQNDEGKTVKVKNSEGGGLFGKMKNKLTDMFNSGKESGMKWFKDVAGYFDYSGDDPEEKKVESKRKKLIGTSVGAMVGGGIFGGPIGLIMGALAGNALTIPNLASRIKEKLFGRDDETGEAKGILSKFSDKVLAPIEYVTKRTFHNFGKMLKKHILGPISDIGFAIKERVTKGVTDTILTPVKKAMKSATKKIFSAIMFIPKMIGKGFARLLGFGDKENNWTGLLGGAGRALEGLGLSKMAIPGGLIEALSIGIAGHGNREAVRERIKQRNKDIKEDKFMDKGEWMKQRRLGKIKAKDVTEDAVIVSQEIEHGNEINSNIEKNTEETVGLLGRILNALHGVRGKEKVNPYQNQTSSTSNNESNESTVSGSTPEEVEDEDIDEEDEDDNITDFQKFKLLASDKAKGIKGKAGTKFRNTKGKVKEKASSFKEAAGNKLAPIGVAVNDFIHDNGGYFNIDGFKKRKTEEDDSEGFANSVVSAAATVGMADASGDDTENKLIGDITNEAARSGSNKQSITNKFKSLLSHSSKSKKDSAEKEEKKEGILSKIGDFISGIASKWPIILAAFLGIKAFLSDPDGLVNAIKGIFNFFNKDSVKTVAGNIGSAASNVADLIANPTEGDAIVKGQNIVLSLADMNVDNSFDMVNPLANVYHNKTDGAGNKIKNVNATNFKNMPYRSTIKQNMGGAQLFKDLASSKYSKLQYQKNITKSNNYFNKALEAENLGDTAKADKYLKRAVNAENKANNNLKASEAAEANTSRPSVGKQVGLAFAGQAVDNAIAKTAGGVTDKLVTKITGNEEYGDRAGAVVTGVSSAGSMAGRTFSRKGSLGQRVANTVADAWSDADSHKLLGKVTTWIRDLFTNLSEKILKNKKIEKILKKEAISKFGDTLKKVGTKAEKAISGEWTEELAKKILAKLGKSATKQGVAAATAGIGIAVSGVAGMFSGLCSVELLFGIAPSDADGKMKLIASLLNGVFEALEAIPLVGSALMIVEMLNDLLASVFGGKNLRQYLAQTIYSLSGGGDALIAKQETLDRMTKEYNDAYGTNLTTTEISDMVNNTGVIDKIWKGKTPVKKDEDGNVIGWADDAFNEAGSRINHGVKGALLNNNYEYEKDENGNIKYDENGKAIIAKDKWGHYKLAEGSNKKIGNYVSDVGNDVKNVTSTVAKGAKNAASWVGDKVGGIFGKDTKEEKEEETPESTVSKSSGKTASAAIKLVKSGFSTAKDVLGNVTSKLFKKQTDDITKAASDLENGDITDENGEPITISEIDENGKVKKTKVSGKDGKNSLGTLLKNSMVKSLKHMLFPFTSITDGVASVFGKDGDSEGIGSKIKDAFTAIGSIFKNSSTAQGGPEEDQNSIAVSTTANVGNTAARLAQEKGAMANDSSYHGGDTNPFKAAYKVTSGYGYPGNRVFDDSKHTGVDIVPVDSKNKEVYSMYDGEVVDVKKDVNTSATRDPNTGKMIWDGSDYASTGNMVSIRLADGTIIKNMHLAYGSIPGQLQKGYKVKAGTALGKMGNTGKSSGEHLHFEVDQNDTDVDPTNYLTGAAQIASSNTSGDDPLDANNSSSGTLGDNSSAEISSTSTTESTPTRKGLGGVLDLITSVGSKILGALTGGLFGDSSSDTSSSSSSSSFGSTSSADTYGAGTTGTLQNVPLTQNANSVWVNIVRAVKKAMALLKPTYNQSNWVDLMVENRKIKTRTDCTGIIATMLKLYGSIDEGENISSSILMSKKELKGFTKANFPGWENLVEGDILVRSGHGEVFANLEGGKHKVYNGGSTQALQSEGPTNSGHDSYTYIFRCQDSGLASAAGMTAMAGNSVAGSVLGNQTFGDANSVISSTTEEVYKALKKMGYSDAAAAGITGTWMAESSNNSKNFEGSFLYKKLGYSSQDDLYKKTFESNQSMNDFMTNVLIPKTKGIKPDAYKGEDGNYYPGLGLAQWTGPRHYKLKQYSDSKGKDWRDMQSQLDFMESELPGRGIDVNTFKGLSDPAEAAKLFANKFEGTYKDERISTRQQNAQNIYAKMATPDSAMSNDPRYQAQGGPSKIRPPKVGFDEQHQGGPETSSTKGTSSNINNNGGFGKLNSDINNVVQTVESKINNMKSNVQTKMGDLKDKANEVLNPNATEIIDLLYQVIDNLESITSNTGESNTLLGSLSENGIQDKGLRNSISSMSKAVKSKPRYPSTTSSGNRMVTNMAKP